MVDFVGGMLLTHPRTAVLIAVIALGMVGTIAIVASYVVSVFAPKQREMFTKLS